MAKAATKKTEMNIEPAVISDRIELETSIRSIGDLQRRKNEIENAANGRIQEIQAELASEIAPIDEKIISLSKGIKAFTDEHREKLIPNGKKSVDLPTGTLAYREKQMRVVTKTTDKLVQKILVKSAMVEAVEKIIQKLRKSFLRVKLELDKDAVLSSPEAAKQFGIEIEAGVERFYIKPNVIDTELEVA